MKKKITARIDESTDRRTLYGFLDHNSITHCSLNVLIDYDISRAYSWFLLMSLHFPSTKRTQPSFNIYQVLILRSHIIWKKVEEYLRLFETYGGNRFSLFLMSGLRKLACFSGRMVLCMKLIAQKELIFLFQMAPSRIL